MMHNYPTGPKTNFHSNIETRLCVEGLAVHTLFKAAYTIYKHSKDQHKLRSLETVELCNGWGSTPQTIYVYKDDGTFDTWERRSLDNNMSFKWMIVQENATEA